jgi:SH3-like domain-containing protein
MSLVFVLLALGAGLGCPVEDAKAPVKTHDVWRQRQNIHSAPHSFSRVVAQVEKGTRLEVLQEGKRWSLVRTAAGCKEGWAVLDAPPKGSGARSLTLEGEASPSSLAMAVKAFDELARKMARLLPEVEQAFASIEGSFLEPSEVEAFAGAGGLRLPVERRQP